MNIPIRVEARRTARGKSYRVETRVTSAARGFFDVAYDRKTHHRALLNEMRLMVRPGRFSMSKPEVAQRWREAILRDAPLLHGFFADEPNWRDKVLRRCEKILAR